jgi:predicted DsbA family dithiol-disulfide isomerase
MQIDVVSDTVCPWCFIGKRRLGRALLLRPDISFDVHWRAYRLDPTIPREGVDRKAYMKAKFGDSPRTAAMGDALREAGQAEDIAFAFDKIERRPDTLDSHRLIRWSSSTGKQNDVVEKLFSAYFEEGRDIGDTKVLVSVAADAGMDSELIAQLLSTDDDREVIEREDMLAHRMGISGVPTFIFDNKFAISGAQEPEMIVQVIDKARAAIQ